MYEIENKLKLINPRVWGDKNIKFKLYIKYYVQNNPKGVNLQV